MKNLFQQLSKNYEGLQQPFESQINNFSSKYSNHGDKMCPEARGDILIQPWIQPNSQSQQKYQDNLQLKNQSNQKKVYCSRKNSFDERINDIYRKHTRHNIGQLKQLKYNLSQESQMNQEGLNQVIPSQEHNNLTDEVGFKKLGPISKNLQQLPITTTRTHINNQVYRCDYRDRERNVGEMDKKTISQYKNNQKFQRVLKIKQKIRKKNSSLVAKIKQKYQIQYSQIVAQSILNQKQDQFHKPQTQANKQRAKHKIKFRGKDTMQLKKHKSLVASQKQSKITVGPIEGIKKIGVAFPWNKDLSFYYTSSTNRQKRSYQNYLKTQFVKMNQTLQYFRK